MNTKQGALLVIALSSLVWTGWRVFSTRQPEGKNLATSSKTIVSSNIASSATKNQAEAHKGKFSIEYFETSPLNHDYSSNLENFLIDACKNNRQDLFAWLNGLEPNQFVLAALDMLARNVELGPDELLAVRHYFTNQVLLKQFDKSLVIRLTNDLGWEKSIEHAKSFGYPKSEEKLLIGEALAVVKSSYPDMVNLLQANPDAVYYTNYIGESVMKQSGSDPNSIIQNVTALPPSLQPSVFQNIARELSVTAPKVVTEMLNSLPTGAGKDLAINGFVIGAKAALPIDTLTWSLAIGDQKMRERVVTSIFVNAQQYSPELAVSTILNSNLRKEFVDELLHNSKR